MALSNLFSADSQSIRSVLSQLESTMGGDSELSVANHASVSGKSSSTSGMIFRSLSSEVYGVVSI